MKLHYYDSKPNFGDLLNEWLWPQVLPDLIDHPTSDIMVGIGTLLDNNLPDGKKLIFGSGFGYNVPPTIDEDFLFFFVRGPLTAESLGIPAELAIADPAVLVGTRHTDRPSKTRKYAYMPHHEWRDHPVANDIIRRNGIHVIDPTAPVETVLREIQSSEIILAEAMHAAIVADALRVPWIPIAINPVNQFKWRDFMGSMRIEAKLLDWDWKKNQIQKLSRISFLKRLSDRQLANQWMGSVESFSPVLSSDAHLEDAILRVEKKVDDLRGYVLNGEQTFWSNGR